MVVLIQTNKRTNKHLVCEIPMNGVQESYYFKFFLT